MMHVPPTTSAYPQITPQEYDIQLMKMEKSRIEQREAMQALPTLSEKIHALGEIRALEDKIHHFKLNYFDMCRQALDAAYADYTAGLHAITTHFRSRPDVDGTMIDMESAQDPVIGSAQVR